MYFMEKMSVAHLHVRVDLFGKENLYQTTNKLLSTGTVHTFFL